MNHSSCFHSPLSYDFVAPSINKWNPFPTSWIWADPETFLDKKNTVEGMLYDF